MLWLPILLVAITGYAQAQETAATRVAASLAECYQSGHLLNRNNLAPTTIQVLIDIIRKIEDNPNVNMDLRQVAAVLLHTYRQDGIEYHPPENPSLPVSANVLPYSPTFHSFFRHRLLLTRLIPNSVNLANDTLRSDLKCAIHHMLSTTVDTRVRGDESSCSQLSQYRALRTARSGRSIPGDVEMLPHMKTGRNGAMRQFNPNDEVEYKSFSDVESERQVAISTCPLLTGVVSTEWGAVSAGNLIAGIAAGTSPQQVPVMQLVRDSNINYHSGQQNVNNIFPATLAGDLAEAVLIQSTERRSSSISIGTAGNWNSSQAHRFFMLHSSVNVEITDPEIRGGIDGFVLGSQISGLLSAFSSLKLSTLLDMYYTPVNGALDPTLRACNRRNISQTLISNATLVSETLAFAAALDTNMPLRGTLTGALDALVNSAVANFQTYTANNLNDLTCANSITITNDNRIATNLYIVLDSSWPYQTIYPAISYLLDEIEVSKFGSNITLLNAMDGSIVIPTTSSIADFHANYTAQRHAAMQTGVNLEVSLTTIRQMMQQQLELETTRHYVGGMSTVLLYLINSGNLQNNERVFEQAKILNETVPDLRILFASSSNQHDNLWNLVRDRQNDILSISLDGSGSNMTPMLAPLSRIRTAGRRIINPLCGATYTAGSSGSQHYDDYVEPGYINFYSVHPNYFYVHNENRRIKISRTAGGVGGLIVCHSRVVEQPRQNSTQADVTCLTIDSTGFVDISLAYACDDHWTIGACPRLYISVQSNTALTSQANAVCTDANCRFPYNIKYQVQIEELGCFSGAVSITASFLFVLTALYFTLNGTL